MVFEIRIRICVAEVTAEIRFHCSWRFICIYKSLIAAVVIQIFADLLDDLEIDWTLLDVVTRALHPPPPFFVFRKNPIGWNTSAAT
jgi:hypothetical protein